jgi:hypothetical protein
MDAKQRRLFLRQTRFDQFDQGRRRRTAIGRGAHLEQGAARLQSPESRVQSLEGRFAFHQENRLT